jgi:hypothetical protein
MKDQERDLTNNHFLPVIDKLNLSGLSADGLTDLVNRKPYI